MGNSWRRCCCKFFWSRACLLAGTWLPGSPQPRCRLRGQALQLSPLRSTRTRNHGRCGLSWERLSGTWLLRIWRSVLRVLLETSPWGFSSRKCSGRQSSQDWIQEGHYRKEERDLAFLEQARSSEAPCKQSGICLLLELSWWRNKRVCWCHVWSVDICLGRCQSSLEGTWQAGCW